MTVFGIADRTNSAQGSGSRVNRWWAGDPAEIFWLEVGARGADLGVDLNAPLTNEVGKPFWSYDLIEEVGDGEIVLHYDREQHAIVAWSIAVGGAWPDTVVWAARGTFARGQNIQPHERPGRRLSLHGPVLLNDPLGLDQIRQERARLEQVRADRPYFPFELGSREVRPLQGYLFKLPAAFVHLFAALDTVPRQPELHTARFPRPGGQSPEVLSGNRPDFVPRNEGVRSRQAKPWLRDPSEIDRALSSHARIERLIAEAASADGWVAHGIGPGDPPFDLLLRRPRGEPEVVVEVKSTTMVNEEKQLRLAIGQVLRYRQVLQAGPRRVEAMIAVEKKPEDESWLELCRTLNVLLAWPDNVRDQLASLVKETRGLLGLNAAEN